MEFLYFNLLIGLINIFFIFINNATNKTMVVKEDNGRVTFKKIFEFIEIYFVMFLIFLIPLLNIAFLYIIIKEMINND